MGELSNLVTNIKMQVINPDQVNNINYNSKSFLKGLKEVNEICTLTEELSIPNHEKKYLSYNN